MNEVVVVNDTCFNAWFVYAPVALVVVCLLGWFRYYRVGMKRRERYGDVAAMWMSNVATLVLMIMLLIESYDGITQFVVEHIHSASTIAIYATIEDRAGAVVLILAISVVYWMALYLCMGVVMEWKRDKIDMEIIILRKKNERKRVFDNWSKGGYDL